MAVYKFLAFKDLYIQTSLCNKFLKKLYKTLNFDLHIISIQYSPHKFLPEKSCQSCLYLRNQHHAKFEKKLMSQSWENLQTDRRTDGRTGRQTLFHRTLPKWPSCPNENFFRKPETCFSHSWLSTCQKSKSDINLLAKYWQLKNTEISLVQRHFWL